MPSALAIWAIIFAKGFEKTKDDGTSPNLAGHGRVDKEELAGVHVWVRAPVIAQRPGGQQRANFVSTLRCKTKNQSVKGTLAKSKKITCFPSPSPKHSPTVGIANLLGSS